MSLNSLHKLSKVGIYVTQNAWKKMGDVIKVSNNQLGFFFHASSGGCNGFNFELDLLDTTTFDKIYKNKPLILTDNKIKLYVDPMSELYLLGTTIDYIHEDYLKGQFENKFIFKVNPKLTSSCGCGVSFSPKDAIDSPSDT